MQILHEKGHNISKDNEKWQLTTPVSFLIFNRPETTARVFEAIRQAQPPKLLVVADGPRSDRPDDVENCQAARAIVEQVDWDCEVLKNYSDVNLGCRKRVISGLDWVFEQVEEAIILEDDCLPHPTFFRYCQELLEKYRNDTRIMMISGDNFQFDRNKTEYSYYFSRYAHIWGWATWKRSWSLFDESMQAWPELRDEKWLDHLFGNEQVAIFWSHIFQSIYDGFNTWDFIWQFIIYLRDGLTILPNINLVSNIGFGSGTHTTMQDSPFANMQVSSMAFPLLHPIIVERNIEADYFTEATQFSRINLSNLTNKIKKCKICESDSYYFAKASILQKYDVDYFQCLNCRFIQTEEPYWLDEAYSKAIASSDVGLVYRNMMMAEITSRLLYNCFDHNGSFLDYGGGYGLFVRLMRDKGFNFYWQDKYCENLFAQGFQLEPAQQNQVLLVTAFELFEHFANPLQEIENILKVCPNILFSTQLLPDNNPKPSEWWYFTPHEGQHISIFTKRSLEIIARKYNLNFYTDGSALHLLTDKVFPEDLFNRIQSGDMSVPNKNSLLSSDYQKVVHSILGQLNSNIKNLHKPIIVIDGVFFQTYSTGIARVWRSLLEEWSQTDFAKHILVLDRGGNSAPKINGIQYRTIPLYDCSNTEADKQMLQEICNQENADLFISTYYTTPIQTPSVFMAYDMIPEVTGANLEDPMWREKHHAIRHASGYLSISENTADDLSRSFTGIDRHAITIAHCGVSPSFFPASSSEIDNFKYKYGIQRPYFLLGNLIGYKNGILFFQAFYELINRHQFDIVCTGAGSQLPSEWRQYTSGCVVHNFHLTDDELRIAYSGAIAFVYPSKYEGFGMPIVEAMICGCPVITTRNASIPEVAGEAALYVGDEDIEAMTDALYKVQKPRVRRSLVDVGLEQAKKFSWKKMANIVQEKLLEIASVSTSHHTKAIVTLAIGDRYQAQWENICRKNWQSYADKHGYDLICITQPLDQSERAQKRSPAWQKCLILSQSFSQKYEQIVWMDADILINPNAPCIAKDVPLNKVGGTEDFIFPTPELYKKAHNIIMGRIGLSFGEDQNLIKDFYTRNGLPDDCTQVIQTGVLVLSPSHHREILEEIYYTYEDLGSSLMNNYEMPPLSYELVKNSLFYSLNYKFNSIYIYDLALKDPDLIRASQDKLNELTRSALKGCYFLHFAGIGWSMDFLDIHALQVSLESQDQSSLALSEVNYLICPDWQASEEDLGLDFVFTLQKLTQEKTQENDRSITLLIDISNTTEEEANLFLSGVALNLMMEEDLEISESLNFSWIYNLSETEWDNLLPQILARIQFTSETLPDREAIESLPVVSARSPNYLIRPDWNLDSDRLTEDLSHTLMNLAQTEENQDACVLIDITGMDVEVMGLYLSELIMTVLLDEEIDLNDRLNISLVQNLDPDQLESLQTITKLITLD